MERNALLAFIISVAILIGYQMVFETPSTEQPAPSAQSTRATGDEVEAPVLEAPKPNLLPAETAAAAAEAKRPVLDSPERVVTIDTDLYVVDVTSWGGRIRSFKLKKFRATNNPDSPLHDLVLSHASLPLGLHWPSADGAKILSDAKVAYEVGGETTRRLIADGKTELVLRGTGPEGERITKTITFRGDGYVLGLDVAVDGRSDDRLAVSWTRTVDAGASHWSGIEGPAILVDGKLKSISASAIEPTEPERYSGHVDWAGYATHYFLTAIAPLGEFNHEFVASRRGELGVATLWTAGGGNHLSFDVFCGPKALEVLATAGHRLEDSVDLGWFSIVARPLLHLLLFIGKFTGNYGWAIIILTILVKAVMYPINQRQSLAMKAMQRLQPELKKIQEKHKDDREALNKEMMELYRRHKVNPLSGCLPMILQIPVFIGLYNALMQSIELRHAPFIGWINDLSQPDRLGTLAIPFVEPPGIPVLTLLMGASMLVQQKMMPAAGDPAQQRMMMFMPLIFTVMFVNFPAGLVIYWFANNLLTIAQQYATNRAAS